MLFCLCSVCFFVIHCQHSTSLVATQMINIACQETDICSLCLCEMLNAHNYFYLTLSFLIHDEFLDSIMDFQDVAFLPSRASSSTTFLKNCGRGYNLGTATCLQTVVGAKRWHAPCEMLSLRQSLFVSVGFHGLPQS